MNRFPNIPRDNWSSCPHGRRFRSFDEFWSYHARPTGTMGERSSSEMGGSERRNR
jgi:hypothetical protein